MKIYRIFCLFSVLSIVANGTRSSKEQSPATITRKIKKLRFQLPSDGVSDDAAGPNSSRSRIDTLSLEVANHEAVRNHNNGNNDRNEDEDNIVSQISDSSYNDDDLSLSSSDDAQHQSTSLNNHTPRLLSANISPKTASAKPRQIINPIERKQTVRFGGTEMIKTNETIHQSPRSITCQQEIFCAFTRATKQMMTFSRQPLICGFMPTPPNMTSDLRPVYFA